MNKVLLLGNLGADPVARRTKADRSVCSFSVATTSRPATDGSPRPPDWHSVRVFGKQADTCVQYLKKGSRVLIDGSLATSTYQSASGEKRYSVTVIASSVTFLDASKNVQGANAPSPVDEIGEITEEDLAI